MRSVDFYDLSDRVRFPKVFLGHLLCQDYRRGGSKDCIRIALEERKCKNFKKLGIGESKIVLVEAVVSDANDSSAGFSETDRLQDLRKITFKSRAKGGGKQRVRESSPARHPFVLYSTEDLIGLFMEAIEAEFALNPEKNQNAGGHADRQPGHVDEGIGLVPSDLPEGDFDIAPYEGGHDPGGMPDRMASLIKISFFVFLSQDVCRSGLLERYTKGRLLVETALDLMIDLIPEMGFQLCDVRILNILALSESLTPFPDLLFKFKHFYLLE